MTIRSLGIVLLVFVLMGIAALFLAGCELSNAGSVTREVGVDFSGVYDSIDGEGNPPFVAPPNSGGLVSSLNLRQSGDQLQAIDNYSIVFKGTIGAVRLDGGTAYASFTLEGNTTAGQPVTISGNLEGQGTTAQMSGTWIEPDRYCTLRGDAIINQIATNKPDTNVTDKVATPAISPNGGNFTNSVTVTITTGTAGATIRFTINNTDPSSGTVYTSPIVLLSSGTVRAIATKDGLQNSEIAQAVFTKL
jgi:hypothetical protein